MDSQVSQGGGSGASGPRAGFGVRLGAALIDGVLLSIVQFVLRAVVDQNTASAIGLLVGLAYFTYFEGGATGQTLGKRVLGIRVYDFGGGGSIGYGRAVVRYLGRYVSAIVILLGYFWMLWDKEKQTWHDKFANAVVVPVSAYPTQS